MFEVKNKTMKKILQSPWIDLYLVLIIAFIAIVFILIPPFNQTFFRILFALVLLLFLPGYVFIAALFPGRDLGGIERFTLSVGLSIAITVFDGFAISVTVWRFRPTSIVVSLSLIILLFVIITFLVRRRLPYEQRFIPDIRPFIKSLLTKEEMNDIEKALIIAMVGSIIIASGMLVYAKLTFEEEKFTALYILGPDGKAESYQTNLSFGTPTSTIVGIENYEHVPVNYTLQIVLDGRVLSSQTMTLKHKEKWEQNVSFIPDTLGSRLKLEFLLFKEESMQQYRSVHLWVSSSIDDTSTLQNYLITGLQIPNGNMEDITNWTYGGRGNYTGHYTDQTYVSASHSYEINLSDGYNTTNTSTGDYGAIYQEFNTSKNGLAVLAFDVKDSVNSNTDGNYLKQVLLNGKMIWEDDVAGHEGWEHVETLASLSQTNRLTLRVYSQKDIQDTAVKVWWDNIRFNTLTRVDINHYDSNVTLGVPANLTVAVENYENEFAGYDLEIKLDNKPVKTYSIGLENSEVREWNVSFIPEAVGNNVKLEVLLYKKGDRREPYRSTHVLISSFIDYENLGTALKYATSPPTVLNSDMEYAFGWNFTGINFNGTYTNFTFHSPAFSYEMWLLPDAQSTTGDFGAIYQDITTVNNEHPELPVLAVLTFDVKDSIKSNNPGNHLKQVLIDGRIIWEDDTAGDEGWQHVEIPVMLYQNNRLILRTYEQQGSSNDVRVWWDNVMFNKFTGQKISENTTAATLPYLEIRDKILSIKAGQTITIKTGLKSTEDLIMYFKADGIVSAGDATYTTRVSSGNIWCNDKKYVLVDPSGTDLLSDILIDGKSKTMAVNDTWVLGSGYDLTVRAIHRKDVEYVLMELIKNDTTVDSNILTEGETFEYEINVNNQNFKILKYKVDSFTFNSVKITGLYLYSDSPYKVEIGDEYGEFQVEEIKADSIIFKNINSIRLSEETAVLNDRVKFKVADNQELAYTYTIETKPGIYKIKGSSHSIKGGNWMNLTGYDYPPFIYDLNTDTSYETLNMYFSSDKHVRAGDAKYTATVIGGKIGFMGKVYQWFDQDASSQILLDVDKETIRLKEPYLLKDGFILTLGDIDFNDNCVFMELTKNDEVVESNFFYIGNTVFFTSVYEGTKTVILEFYIENIFGETIIVKNLKQYAAIPFTPSIGDMYGEFKITEISNNAVVMKNVDPITINDQDTIFNGWIKFDVSGTTATPYLEKRL